MNSYTFAIHDLNNKLMTLYGLIKNYKQGNPPKEEKVNAVIERINELMKSLYSDFEPSCIDRKKLESFNQSELQSFMDFSRNKLTKIFDDLEITTQSSWFEVENHLQIEADKHLLQQVIENAIENCRNAKATKVTMRAVWQDQQAVIEICDNGEGFKEREKPDRLISHATGCIIIKENMRAMGAETNYDVTNPSGVTLRLIFPVKH